MVPPLFAFGSHKPSLIIKLVLSFSFVLSIASDAPVFSTRLSPRIVTIKENEVAAFRCSYSCAVKGKNTHTTLWLVGDMDRPKFFYNSKFSQRNFMAGAGDGLVIVDVVSRSTCDQPDGQVIDELTINVTSAYRWNRTPIQCVAQATRRHHHNFYSTYAVLLVEEHPKVEGTTSLPSPQPCPTPATVEVTHTEVITTSRVVTKTKEVTVNKEVTVTLASALHSDYLSPSSSVYSSSSSSSWPEPTNIPMLKVKEKSG